MEMVAASSGSETGGRAHRQRWVQLVLGITCMVAIANVQYGWTLFINPIAQKYGWSTTALQWTFSIVILTETFLVVPLGGYWIDRLSPKLACLAGPSLMIAWYINSKADALHQFYIAAAISGIATGLVFAAAYGNAAKWFPDRRGLALGLTAAGFAGGGVLMVVPLDGVIRSHGYETAYLWFGVGQGLVALVCGLLLRSPRPGEVAAPPSARVAQEKRDHAPLETLRSPSFWLMYSMFVLVGTGGLMLQAELAPIARDLAIDKVAVTILGLTMLTPIFAVSLGQVTNGFSRFAFGWLSDRAGRELTMFIAFSLEASAFVAIMFLAESPIWFILLTALAFFAWGEIFSLFPAVCADTFGNKFLSANYGMLYTAKGVASLLVPFASMLKGTTGSWSSVFAVAAAFNLVAAMLALLLLRARKRALAKATAPGLAAAA
jgi:OFA family oxalate/formate antiporter-like MFS transporter